MAEHAPEGFQVSRNPLWIVLIHEEFAQDVLKRIPSQSNPKKDTIKMFIVHID